MVCTFEGSYFDHCVSFQAVSLFLRLLRFVVHLLSSQLRLPPAATTTTTTALVHYLKRVRRQVHIFVVGPCERCLHLGGDGQKRCQKGLNLCFVKQQDLLHADGQTCASSYTTPGEIGAGEDNVFLIHCELPYWELLKSCM